MVLAPGGKHFLCCSRQNKSKRKRDIFLLSLLPLCRNLGGLAFLDLAQNYIQDITAADLSGLTALTALNLERNVIQKLDDDIFQEVKRSLSSVSLLNNLLTKYPEGAITSLKDLRVSHACCFSIYSFSCSEKEGICYEIFVLGYVK
jgi:Leucine-rich repeat (LRR) protein